MKDKISAEELFNDFENTLRTYIQVYFTNESGLHDINVKAESVDKILIKDGFLKIHDNYDNGWHCYNIKYVKHFHFPGGIKL